MTLRENAKPVARLPTKTTQLQIMLLRSQTTRSIRRRRRLIIIHITITTALIMPAATTALRAMITIMTIVLTAVIRALTALQPVIKAYRCHCETVWLCEASRFTSHDSRFTSSTRKKIYISIHINQHICRTRPGGFDSLGGLPLL